VRHYSGRRFGQQVCWVCSVIFYATQVISGCRDKTSITEELKRAGFTRIRRCNFGDSGIPMFDVLEEASRFSDI
jgi:hypothetical protein